MSIEVKFDYIEIDRRGDEVNYNFTIEADYIPGDIGSRRGDPGDWTPDTDEEIEILSVIDQNGDSWDFNSFDDDYQHEVYNLIRSELKSQKDQAIIDSYDFGPRDFDSYF